MDKAAIKQKVCEAIAAHRADIEAISEAILAEPELGFKEVKTSRKVQEALERLGIEFTAGHGITGVKARMKGRNSKRTVAMLAELTGTPTPSRAPPTAAATTSRSPT